VAGRIRTGGEEGALSRRLRTIPTLCALFVGYTILLPVMVVGALAIDLVRWLRRRVSFIATRLVVFGWAYLVGEVLALGGLLVTWVLSGFGRIRTLELRLTYRLQGWWAGALFWAIRNVFSMRLVIEDDHVVVPGPVLVFVRHASIADVLLANAIVTRRHGLLLRYVLKKELLVDPAIDVAGNRLINYFVHRGAGGEGEIERLRQLAEGLTPWEGVLIYPEGTRYTVEKARRAAESVARRLPDLAERARSFRHVLPPRLGGSLALLAGAPDADVVVVSHVGLDGLATVKDLWGGDIVGATVRVSFRRVARSTIPEGADAQADWLFREWAAVDEWIDRQKRRR
jgi:1-acyl-sn-glycerol-3-phosphate acyltransferase